MCCGVGVDELTDVIEAVVDGAADVEVDFDSPLPPLPPQPPRARAATAHANTFHFIPKNVAPTLLRSRSVSTPEIRIDPLTGLRAIVAGARAQRPGGGLSATPAPELDPAEDPFAEGNEQRTPPEVYAVRPNGGGPDTPGWTVRVVPNLYPGAVVVGSTRPARGHDRRG